MGTVAAALLQVGDLFLLSVAVVCEDGGLAAVAAGCGGEGPGLGAFSLSSCCCR